MFETRDYISLLIGAVVFLLGLFPLLAQFKIGPAWFALNFLSVTIVSWVVAVAALYLVYASVIEITNSSTVGNISILIALVVLAVGLLPILKGFLPGAPAFFALPWLTPIIYRIVFMVEGLFLVIAMWAMEM
jgi:hypothetical protein